MNPVYNEVSNTGHYRGGFEVSTIINTDSYNPDINHFGGGNSVSRTRNKAIPVGLAYKHKVPEKNETNNYKYGDIIEIGIFNQLFHNIASITPTKKKNERKTRKNHKYQS